MSKEKGYMKYIAFKNIYNECVGCILKESYVTQKDFWHDKEYNDDIVDFIEFEGPDINSSGDISKEEFDKQFYYVYHELAEKAVEDSNKNG